MSSKVVFFGEADYGKSTLIGYLYACSLGLDMNKVEARLKQKLGANYSPEVLYSSLINPDIVEIITKEDKTIQEIDNVRNLVEGTKILKDSDDEIVTQTTTIIGTRAKIITTTHKKRVSRRLNSIVHHLKNINIGTGDEPVKITMIDTPGHAIYLSERDIGISMSDIGVFCLAVNEVLSDDFGGLMFELSHLWSLYNRGRKLIYLLTKFDLAGYREEDYIEACSRINAFCRYVNVDVGGGMSGPLIMEEPDAVAIIPVAVDPVCREGVNIFGVSERTPWYRGPSLLETVKNQMYELANESRRERNDRLLFSVDKEIASPRSNVGKVWRVHIRNGTLHVDDKIRLTSVSLEGRPRGETCDIEAAVKSIHEELDALEGVADTDAAYTGGIVTIDLKGCTADGRRIDKKEIQITKQSYGLGQGETYRHHNTVTIRFSDIEQALEIVKLGQEVMLLWFGKGVPAKITGIDDSFARMEARLLHGRTVAIPDSEELRDLEAVQSIKVLAQNKGKNWHFAGFVEF